MNDIRTQKQELRSLIKKRKAGLSFDEKILRSEKIFSFVEKQEWFISAQVVMAYWSLSDEVNTHDFIRRWMTRKTILLPRMTGPDIEPVHFTGCLKKENTLGIGEPDGLPYADTDMINIIIVPGVAFDKAGNRMGRGKGYYDRFLNSIKALKIGVCFEEQVVHFVPGEAHDVPMDMMVYF